jgi:hypothetical protein
MPFALALAEFLDFCGGGSLPVICMNGDETVFRENCRLNGLDFPFEKSFHRLWPYLDSIGVDPALSSGDLHALTPTPLEGHVHYALHDVRSMACWLREETSAGRFRDLGSLPTGAPATDRRSSTPGS